MAIEITVPRLGWSMEEGVFAGWLKGDGAPVRAGEPLFSLEGDKATQDVEALDGGTLHLPPTAPAVGDTIAVGAVIGYLLAPGEPAPSAPVSASTSAPAAASAAPEPAPPALAPAPAPAAASAARGRPRSSPLARRIARENGIDWTGLQGTGRTGRIRRADVLRALEARPAAAPSGGNGSPGSPPVSPARRAIAGRMVESLRTTAPVTLTTTVDATNLVSLRRQFQAASEAGGRVPGYTDVVVKLVALALREHPALHSRWEGDRVVTPAEAHVGVAVDTEAGLFVPVIRGAAGLGLRQVAALAHDLAERARSRRLRPGETHGGTFTVTNLGAFGVEAFTPILNPPETAILGMGRIERRPVMDGDRVVGRERMVLSLTFDHRVVDGAPAARFLQHLTRLVENPGPWLIP